MTGSTLDAAQTLAERGMFVFAILPGGKKPAWPKAHGDKDPCRGECGQLGHGCHDATRDPAVIRAMWGRYPRANVAISTGPSGLVVIDLDTKTEHRPARVLREQGDGEPTPDGVRDAHGVLRWLCNRRRGHVHDLQTLTVETPTGGHHLYYRRPDGLEVTGGAGMQSGLGWCLDVRAAGGYVVCPPSTRREGPYRTAYHAPILDLPRWLMDALAAAGKIPAARPVRASGVPVAPPAPGSSRRGAYVFRAVQGEVQRVLDAAEGTRNVTLNRAAFSLGQLVGAGLLDEDAASGALLTAAGAAGLPEREADATIRSGLRAGAKSPRSATA